MSEGTIYTIVILEISQEKNLSTIGNKKCLFVVFPGVIKLNVNGLEKNIKQLRSKGIM